MMPSLGVRNRLLGELSADQFALVAPHLQPMQLHTHQALVEPNEAITKIAFVEAGLISITSPGARAIELGLIGHEGAVGASAILLESPTSPFRHFAQATTELLTIDVDVATRLFDRTPTLRSLLLRFLHVMGVQTAQTAFVNAAYDIEARLARWLLMCQDRINGSDLALTHEFLGIMLGVQRTSVTLTLQTLEGGGLIRARRGRISIRDRAGLIAVADSGYGVPEAEYAKLIGSV